MYNIKIIHGVQHEKNNVVLLVDEDSLVLKICYIAN